MKYFCILILFISQVALAQNPTVEKANRLHQQRKYSEEIDLRKSLLEAEKDKESEFYKTQLYKIRIAEFFTSKNSLRYKKIFQADSIIATMAQADPKDKINTRILLVESGEDPEASQKLDDIIELVKSLPDSKEKNDWISRIYLAYGNVYLALQELDDAVAYLEKAVEFNTEVYGHNSEETAQAYYLLSITHSYTNNYPAVLDNADKALRIFEIIDLENPLILFKQYQENMSSTKYYGDVKRFKELYEKLNNYFEKHKNNPEFIYATHSDYLSLNPVYSTLYYGRVQYANFMSDAVAAEKALRSFEQRIPKGNVPYSGYEKNLILSYYFETGSLFHSLDKTDMENYQKAKKYYQKVTDFTKSQDFDFGEIQSYMMLSMLGVDFKQWDDVVTYSEKALEHPAIESFNQVQTIEHNLGLAYLEIKEYQKAFDVFEKEYEFYLNDSGVDYYALTNLMESGQAYLDIYEETKNEKFLENAYSNFLLASQIFSKLYRGGEFSPRLAQYSSAINQGLLFSSIRLGKYMEEVVSRIEINNSDYLWSSFLNNSKGPMDEVELKIQNQLDSLQNRQETLAKRIARKRDRPEILDDYRTELKSTERLFADVQEKLKNEDESFYEFARGEFNLTEVQNNIRENEKIIKYILTKTISFVYVIDKNEVQLMELDTKPDELREIVLTVVNSVKNRSSDFNEESKLLHQALIQPLNLESGVNLVIIPDQFLAYLPFEILMDNEDEFLIKNHAISYGYSLKLMKLQKSLARDNHTRLAAFSPEYNLHIAETSDDEEIQVLVRSGNYKLAGAEDESKRISEFFGGDLYLGKEASKSNFQDKAGGYDILHLAMHAIVNKENSNQSNLIFNNDERLYLEELYQMKIPANLAVLSACDTGFGELVEGEGVQSLSRAFTYAGVKSTVMSLWPVPDKQTSIIMEEFYKQLKAGASKADALKQAKLNYLENVSEEELKHPFYWAGFLISGDADPIKTTGERRWLVIGWVFMLFILFMAFARRRK